jgi:DNA-binding protein HU-beta
VNRRDLVLALSERLATDRRSADAAVTALTELITETVAKGEPVVISGFAKFARVDRAARMGRNPQTGAAIKIKASRRARITALKGFKDAVLAGKAPVKKAAVAKAPAKKAAVAKAPVKKATVTKAPAKKAPVKKAAPAKKAPAKKATTRR